jgi:hypothetical protein
LIQEKDLWILAAAGAGIMESFDHYERR